MSCYIHAILQRGGRPLKEPNHTNQCLEKVKESFSKVEDTELVHGKDPVVIFEKIFASNRGADLV